jgi:hypothetical protein
MQYFLVILNINDRSFWIKICRKLNVHRFSSTPLPVTVETEVGGCKNTDTLLLNHLHARLKIHSTTNSVTYPRVDII